MRTKTRKRGREEFTALVSDDDDFEYLSSRIWDASRPIVLACLTNPVLGHHEDDPAIQKLERLADFWGMGGVRVVYLFAKRSKHPTRFGADPTAIGSENSYIIAKTLRAHENGIVLAAWGVHGLLQNRDKWFMQLAEEYGHKVACLAVSGTGYPRHPLARGEYRVSETAMPIPYTMDLRREVTTRLR